MVLRHLFFICLFLVSPLFAQTVVIEGKVRDANTYREIPNVNVYIEALDVGATTNISGRFSFTVRDAKPDMAVVFEHVAYDTLRLTYADLIGTKDFYMQERVIPLPAIQVEAEGEKLEIERDLPQNITVIEAKDFEMRGYVDGGDLLRVDQSIQVDEELSGKKTVAIRGGNPDEVVVLYNGIKMNSPYNNEFDLSHIDTEDIERFEVIKGSNTVLYGPEAFSGVVNIVPKKEQDYTVRFRQRFGTYASGNWGAHLYYSHDDFYSNYSFKKGGSQRRFSGIEDGSNLLTNKTEHQTLNLLYDLPDGSGSLDHSVGAVYVRSVLDFDNQRDAETLLNFNQMVSLQYTGGVEKFNDVSISGAYQWLDESQHLIICDEVHENGVLCLSSFLINRELNNRSYTAKMDKGWSFSRANMMIGYQFEQTQLDFVDERGQIDDVQIGVESATFDRIHHGVVAIAKFHSLSGSDHIKQADFDISFRYDNVQDDQSDAVFRQDISLDSTGLFESNDWGRGMAKFSAHISGGKEDFAFNTFMNFGSNVKFPTLFQQISTPDVLESNLTQPNLSPEENRSLEIGVDMTWDTRNHPSVYGYQVSGSYFKNSYKNKFISSVAPGNPVPFYANIRSAQISGFEGKTTFFLYRKKVSAQFGISHYNISEKAAFPFKHDQKRTASISLDHAGYSFQFFWFKESEQIGLVRNQDRLFLPIELPEYSNIDLHVGKFFEIKKLKLILNASVRNLLDDDFELQGLALRDRRYYVTFAAQY